MKKKSVEKVIQKKIEINFKGFDFYSRGDIWRKVIVKFERGRCRFTGSCV
jgi:hypothetical protein